MLTATDLACSRGERTLFGGLSFALDAGDWLHVKGENGTGKTTLLRTLAGLAPADRGQIRWDGSDASARNGHYRRAVLYLGHPAALKDELTPLENLSLALALDGRPIDTATLVAALHRMHLQGREDVPVRHLSAGQKRRVLLARLLVRPADLWLLDEPFAALDADGIVLLCRLIGEHLERGGIVVLTSHQAVALPGGQELRL